METQKRPIIDMHSDFLSGVYSVSEMEGLTPGKNWSIS